MVLRLFDKSDLGWTNQANTLAQEAREVLQPLVAKWSAAGYSIREISHIISWSVNDLEIEHVIDVQTKEGNNGK